jgi:protein-S-isoprenylcysteine O-methyltransferase Ste14
MRFLLRVPVPWVFVLAYLLGAALESMTRRAISPDTARVTTIAGVVLFVAGALLAGWGLTIFRSVRTTTVPGEASKKLVTWGPYRFTRNPMYVGLSLAYLGEAGLLKQIYPVLLLPLVIAYVNWTVIPLEEKRLTEVFGREYEAYRSKVRRWV